MAHRSYELFLGADLAADPAVEVAAILDLLETEQPGPIQFHLLLIGHHQPPDRECYVASQLEESPEAHARLSAGPAGADKTALGRRIKSPR
jgi:hypothetical protein